MIERPRKSSVRHVCVVRANSTRIWLIVWLSMQVTMRMAWSVWHKVYTQSVAQCAWLNVVLGQCGNMYARCVAQ